MTFEEDFPGLITKIRNRYKKILPTLEPIDNYFTEKEKIEDGKKIISLEPPPEERQNPQMKKEYVVEIPVIDLSDVEQHCLDKQKVREAIRKLQIGDYNEGLLPDEEGYKDNPKSKMIDAEELELELGL